VFVGACGSGGGGTADSVDDSALVPASTVAAVSTTVATNNATVAGARVEPATTAVPTVSPFAPAAQGPNVTTWIAVDRAGKSAEGARVRSHSDLLYDPPLGQPTIVYSTPNATPSQSEFITGLSVSADGRTAFFGQTTTDLTALPYRCSMKLMAVEQGGSPRQLAAGVSPAVSPDSGQVAFTSGGAGSCQLTQLNILNHRGGTQRDSDIAAFLALLSPVPDKASFAQISAAYWSADSRWLAVSFSVANAWAATAIVDARDGRLQLVRPNDDLQTLTKTIVGETVTAATLRTEAVAWTANGAVALRVSCFGCGAGVYALAQPDAPAEAAVEPKLAANTAAAFMPWLGRYENWVLVSDLNGIVARSDTKNVLLFQLDGFTANAAWPAGQQLLPTAP
jgi:hypothetical protein